MAKKKYYDGGMSGLPGEVKIKKYPPFPGYVNSNLDDTITGIDNQVRQDKGKRKNNSSQGKF